MNPLPAYRSAIPRAPSPWTPALSEFFVGCANGPVLGVVTGKVVQQGKHIPFAYVELQPIDPPGTYVAAYTQADGT